MYSILCGSFTRLHARFYQYLSKRNFYMDKCQVMNIFIFSCYHYVLTKHQEAKAHKNIMIKIVHKLSFISQEDMCDLCESSIML
mmetsp:Transcript_3816/g.8005  ORF Transcript_3816/g.8005 Transcript_3816/m.8005 type:complete len:84 (+) Transcript_3816:894-1145(+)